MKNLNTFLAIDAGNTKTKYALFHRGRIVSRGEVDGGPRPRDIARDVAGMICQTRRDPRINDWGLTQLKRPIPLRRSRPYVGMPVAYGPTLGEDRLLNAWYLYRHLPTGQGLCLVGAGTFLTVDFLRGGEGLLGGYIFPGLSLVRDTYKTAPGLPVPGALEGELSAPQGPGFPLNSQQAVDEAYKLLFRPVVALIQKHQDQFSFLTITGGQGALVRKFLGRGSIRPDLTFVALKTMGEAIL